MKIQYIAAFALFSQTLTFSSNVMMLDASQDSQFPQNSSLIYGGVKSIKKTQPVELIKDQTAVSKNLIESDIRVLSAEEKSNLLAAAWAKPLPPMKLVQKSSSKKSSQEEK